MMRVAVRPLRSGLCTLSKYRLGSSVSQRSLPADGLTLEDFLPGPAPTGPGSGGALPPQEAEKSSSAPVKKREPKPAWLKMYNPAQDVKGQERYSAVKKTVKKSGLATVCEEARCPNIGECWSAGTATVMIMGDTCTRGCRFCSVATSKNPTALDPKEPEKLAEAVASWDVDYIVVTMVDRDDVADQGASHVAASVRALKEKGRAKGLLVETLVGDFQGNTEHIGEVVRSNMDVFAHNIETVERLTKQVRDRRAGYAQTLDVLRHAKVVRPDVLTKTSLMLGFGETADEIKQTLCDLREANVDIVTFGQYLQPTKRHMKVFRYVTPAEFDEFKVMSESMGFHCASGPLVRSSYKAGELYRDRLAKRAAAAE